MIPGTKIPGQTVGFLGQQLLERPPLDKRGLVTVLIPSQFYLKGNLQYGIAT